MYIGNAFESMSKHYQWLTMSTVAATATAVTTTTLATPVTVAVTTATTTCYTSPPLTPGGSMVKLKYTAQLGTSVGSSEESFLMALRGVNASLTAILKL